MIESRLYLTCWDCGLKLAFQAEGLGRSAGREAHMRCLQMALHKTSPPPNGQFLAPLWGW